jgi:hypothetical protein
MVPRCRTATLITSFLATLVLVLTAGATASAEGTPNALQSVGQSSPLPTDPDSLAQLLGTWPTPDGSHLRLFLGGGPDETTYAVRVNAGAQTLAQAIALPGYFDKVTFGPDGTAYLLGTDAHTDSSSVA